MKYFENCIKLNGDGSRPARALWIEIAKLTNYRIEQLESRPARALWIEI